MSGLLMKDLIILKRSLKSLGAMLLIFILSGWLDESNGMMMAIAFVLSMSVMSSFSYDQFSNWEVFALVAPISKKQYVTAKYLLGGILSLVGASLVLLVMGLKLVIKGGISGELLFVTVVCALLGSSILSMFTLPFLFKFPIEKARYVSMGLVAAFFVIGVVLGKIQERVNVQLPVFISEMNAGQVMLIFLGLAVIVLVISFPLSCHLFKQKFS